VPSGISFEHQAIGVVAQPIDAGGGQQPIVGKAWSHSWRGASHRILFPTYVDVVVAWHDAEPFEWQGDGGGKLANEALSEPVLLFFARGCNITVKNTTSGRSSPP
jgi:hypothetical protein